MKMVNHLFSSTSKKLLYFVFCSFMLLFIFHRVNGQTKYPVISDRLETLNKPNEVVHNYVNFDVLKLIICRGTASNLPVPNAWNLSLKVQYLYPYAQFKDIFPIAFGGIAGYDKIAVEGHQFDINNNKLSGITPNPHIRKSKVWWYHAGVVVAPVVRLRRMTLLPGCSFNVNFAGRMKEKLIDDTKHTSNVKDLRWFSVPVFIQVSYSKKQFASYGVYGGIQRSPLVVEGTMKKMTQFSLGVTGAVIF